MGEAAPRTPCWDAESLAAYVDGRMEAAERAAMERHLVECGECRDLIGAAAELAGASEAAVTAPPRLGAVRWYIAGAGLVAAAAALVLMVRIQGGSSGPYVAEISQLRDAVNQGGERPTLGRLTGGFDYLPPPRVTRGQEGASVSPDVAVAAALVEKRVAAGGTAAGEASLGVAALALRNPDIAVEHLEKAVALDPENARYLTDLAAAYIERGTRLNDSQDFERAERAARGALRHDRRLAEATFNLALALTLRGQRDAATAFWLHFETLERDPRWIQEARRHQPRP